jgi:site-specific recombinase XerD
LGTFPQVTPDEARASWQTKRLLIVPSSVSLPSIYRQIPKITKVLTIKEGYRLYEQRYAKENLSINTVKLYSSLMFEMADFLNDPPMDSVSEHVMFDYLESLDEFKAKGNRMKSAFSSTHRWLKKKRLITSTNPTLELEHKKEIPKTRKLSERELEGFITGLNNSQVTDTHNVVVK